ncbi:UPF0692 protein CG33108 [Anoplophora glabripennis]|uniref:UPF0692 protein CG33108 n=1 Tax=Anoplophora glabripennis TaxID=217634 RepID=UPI000874D2FF|nr:UPF0692 protein CG33108 [Anoplophora glabripennis]
MEYSWAKNYPEIHKMCTLFQMTELSNPIKYNYNALNGYLQDGPQCGLVALMMCTGSPNNDTVKHLYDYAKRKGYTNNGEIFSVDDMADVAKYYLPKKANVEIFEGDLFTTKIKEFLLDGGMALVPYDTNKDNSPGFHSGHKAHWAIISGSILTDDDFYVIARHGKARNVAIWKLKILARSNSQLQEFSPDRKLHDVEYKLPEGGINGPLGLNRRCILIKL